MTPRPTDRKGLAIVPALVCLMLVGMLCGAMLRQAKTRRDLARDVGDRAQAEWLAESGAARATARLAADRAYRGESWDVPARALGGDSAGKVTIAVSDRKGRRGVRVEADYPVGPHRARHSKEWTVELRTETPGGPS